MSDKIDVNVTDEETRAWTAALSSEEAAELKRQALHKRALELAQPENAPDFASMSDAELERFKQKNGFYK